MEYYAGLDVSLEETAICVVDGTGRIVKKARAASEPDALAAALNQLDLPLERIGLEACSLTAWLHDGLRAAGLAAICIETRQANAAMKTMPNKTDRNDARALAQIMRTGWFRQVHVKSRHCRLWRSLLVARRAVLNEMRTIENVVRAILREAGLKLRTPGRAAFADCVRELADRDPRMLAERAKELAPNSDLAWHYLGHLSSRLGQHARTVMALERAAGLAPTSGAIRMKYALAQRRQGDDAGALRTLRKLTHEAFPGEARRKVAAEVSLSRALGVAALGRRSVGLMR